MPNTGSWSLDLQSWQQDYLKRHLSMIESLATTLVATGHPAILTRITSALDGPS